MRQLANACLLFLALPLGAAAAECRFSAQRDFDVDAAALKTLALDLAASDVWVEGVPGLDKVEVRARACASRQDWLEALTVEHAVAADRLTVTPKGRDASVNISLLGSSYAWIELRIRVPQRLAVAVTTGAGDADVRKVAALEFKSGSGDLQVHDIAGAVVLALGSADASGANIGSLELRAVASGDVDLRQIRGDAKLGPIGSGDVVLDGVGGKVSAESVGSGDLELTHVTGDVQLESIGSGDLRVRDVGGNLRVARHGSGDIDYRDVRGKVELPGLNDE
ncbi:DUF4097 family beta strand repeat-containing protein [Dokdonella sp.]|uniref:DUF4097 family beta strand repeat-containing protein n=1 Tax=Dokdonella sp. TaxID=2291710 RepID=UPI0027B88EB0|nr:DUF4097 family beta strand repeat-containing protein [Dokdonella sp.]